MYFRTMHLNWNIFPNAKVTTHPKFTKQIEIKSVMSSTDIALKRRWLAHRGWSLEWTRPRTSTIISNCITMVLKALRICRFERLFAIMVFVIVRLPGHRNKFIGKFIHKFIHAPADANDKPYTFCHVIYNHGIISHHKILFQM